MFAKDGEAVERSLIAIMSDEGMDFVNAGRGARRQGRTICKKKEQYPSGTDSVDCQPVLCV